LYCANKGVRIQTKKKQDSFFLEFRIYDNASPSIQLPLRRTVAYRHKDALYTYNMCMNTYIYAPQNIP